MNAKPLLITAISAVVPEMKALGMGIFRTAAAAAFFCPPTKMLSTKMLDRVANSVKKE